MMTLWFICVVMVAAAQGYFVQCGYKKVEGTFYGRLHGELFKKSPFECSVR